MVPLNKHCWPMRRFQYADQLSGAHCAYRSANTLFINVYFNTINLNELFIIAGDVKISVAFLLVRAICDEMLMLSTKLYELISYNHATQHTIFPYASR